MKKKFWFFLSLIAVAVLSCVLMPSKDTFAEEDDKVQATFDYNIGRIESYLPENMIQNIENKTVDVEGMYVQEPLSINSSIFYYYDFVWTVNDEPVDLDTYVVLQDTTFKAVWTPRQYTIYYKYMTNEELGEITNLKVTETYSIESSVVYYRPERPHYVFLDWYSSPQFKNDEICMYTPKYSIGDKVIYAKFQPIEYLITYHTDAKNTDNPRSYNIASPDYELEEPVLEGHIFKGWYLDEKCTYEYTTITKGSYGDLDLYPLWELVEYNVKYIMPDGNTEVVKTKYGQTATPPKNTNSIFQLVVYEGDRNNITSDVEIKVKYVNIWYLYVLGLIIIVGIIVAVVYAVIRKKKQLHKLRYIYQSNFKRK